MSNQDYNIKKVLGVYKNKTSLNTDTFVGIEFTNKSRLVEPDNNTFILNSISKFNEERNNSDSYRLSGRLQLISSNIFPSAFGNIPSEDDWDLESTDDNFIGKNWLLQISYPFENDITTPIATRINGVDRITNPSDGIQIESVSSINLNGRRPQTLLKTVQRHGIKELGEFIYITPLYSLSYLGFHKVIGFETNNEEHGLILDTVYKTGLYSGNMRRVFEPSLEDSLFMSSINIEQVSACDSDGLGIGPLTHTKIYHSTHGLRIGEYIDLRFTISSNINGLHRILKIPTQDEFVIEYQLPGTTTTTPVQINTIVPAVTLSYRVVNGTPSEYYIRKFKVLTKLQDYELYKAGFSSGIFSDNINNDIKAFHFNKDIHVGDLVDNIGRPLSNLYLTITRRANPFSDTLLLFEENRSMVPISTINTPFVLETMSYWDSSGLGSIQKGNSGDTFYGDFVEYNSAFLEETIISETICRFSVGRILNTNLDFDNGINEGYYYKFHNNIEIRKFSNIIETVENKSNEIFPDHIQINNDGTVSWRDLLDIGFFEESGYGVDYPFVNGSHYLFDNYNIYIRRQLPPSLIDTNLEDLDFVKISPDKLNTKGLGEKC